MSDRFYSNYLGCNQLKVNSNINPFISLTPQNGQALGFSVLNGQTTIIPISVSGGGSVQSVESANSNISVQNPDTSPLLTLNPNLTITSVSLNDAPNTMVLNDKLILTNTTSNTSAILTNSSLIINSNSPNDTTEIVGDVIDTGVINTANLNATNITVSSGPTQYILPTSNGSANQVLTAQANGTCTWSTVSPGGGSINNISASNNTLIVTDGEGPDVSLAVNNNLTVSSLISNSITTTALQAGTVQYPSVGGTNGQVLGMNNNVLEFLTISPGGIQNITSDTLTITTPSSNVKNVELPDNLLYNYSLPSDLGISGQVLATPASGSTLQWIDQPTPGGGGITQILADTNFNITNATGPTTTINMASQIKPQTIVCDNQTNQIVIDPSQGITLQTDNETDDIELTLKMDKIEMINQQTNTITIDNSIMNIPTITLANPQASSSTVITNEQVATSNILCLSGDYQLPNSPPQAVGLTILSTAANTGQILEWSASPPVLSVNSDNNMDANIDNGVLSIGLKNSVNISDILFEDAINSVAINSNSVSLAGANNQNSCVIVPSSITISVGNQSEITNQTTISPQLINSETLQAQNIEIMQPAPSTELAYRLPLGEQPPADGNYLLASSSGQLSFSEYTPTTISSGNNNINITNPISPNEYVATMSENIVIQSLEIQNAYTMPTTSPLLNQILQNTSEGLAWSDLPTANISGGSNINITTRFEETGNVQVINVDTNVNFTAVTAGTITVSSSNINYTLPDTNPSNGLVLGMNNDVLTWVPSGQGDGVQSITSSGGNLTVLNSSGPNAVISLNSSLDISPGPITIESLDSQQSLTLANAQITLSNNDTETSTILRSNEIITPLATTQNLNIVTEGQTVLCSISASTAATEGQILVSDQNSAFTPQDNPAITEITTDTSNNIILNTTPATAGKTTEITLNKSLDLDGITMNNSVENETLILNPSTIQLTSPGLSTLINSNQIFSNLAECKNLRIYDSSGNNVIIQFPQVAGTTGQLLAYGGATCSWVNPLAAGSNLSITNNTINLNPVLSALVSASFGELPGAVSTIEATKLTTPAVDTQNLNICNLTTQNIEYTLPQTIGLPNQILAINSQGTTQLEWITDTGANISIDSGLNIGVNQNGAAYTISTTQTPKFQSIEIDDVDDALLYKLPITSGSQDDYLCYNSNGSCTWQSLPVPPQTTLNAGQNIQIDETAINTFTIALATSCEIGSIVSSDISIIDQDANVCYQFPPTIPGNLLCLGTDNQGTFGFQNINNGAQSITNTDNNLQISSTPASNGGDNYTINLKNSLTLQDISGRLILSPSGINATSLTITTIGGMPLYNLPTAAPSPGQVISGNSWTNLSSLILGSSDQIVVSENSGLLNISLANNILQTMGSYTTRDQLSPAQIYSQVSSGSVRTPLLQTYQIQLINQIGTILYSMPANIGSAGQMLQVPPSGVGLIWAYPSDNINITSNDGSLTITNNSNAVDIQISNPIYGTNGNQVILSTGNDINLKNTNGVQNSTTINPVNIILTDQAGDSVLTLTKSALEFQSASSDGVAALDIQDLTISNSSGQISTYSSGSASTPYLMINDGTAEQNKTYGLPTAANSQNANVNDVLIFQGLTNDLIYFTVFTSITGTFDCIFSNGTTVFDSVYTLQKNNLTNAVDININLVNMQALLCDGLSSYINLSDTVASDWLPAYAHSSGILPCQENNTPTIAFPQGQYNRMLQVMAQISNDNGNLNIKFYALPDPNVTGQAFQQFQPGYLYFVNNTVISVSAGVNTSVQSLRLSYQA